MLKYASLYESVAALRSSLSRDALVRFRDYLDTLIADIPSTTESASGESETDRPGDAECVCPDTRSGDLSYARCTLDGCRCNDNCHCDDCYAEHYRPRAAS